MLTIILELYLSLALGYGKKSVFAIIVANLLTNPALNILLYINHFYINISYWFLITVAELLIVLIEWRILKILLRNVYTGRNFLLDAVYLNVFSFVVGYLILIFLGS